MWKQIGAVAWAQFRISRNHLPRTNIGTVLSWLLLSMWYGLYVSLAVLLAFDIPSVPIPQLTHWLPSGLFGVFLFWQVVPLLTLSSGWSLQLNKLQIYPISSGALFALETLLRITSAPEMIIILLGAALGLARHGAIPAGAPLALAFFIPFNLFLQLAIRDLVLHSFERNRFRELFAVFIISVGVVPQLLLRSGLATKLKPYFFATAGNHVAPWFEVASLSLGRFSILDLALIGGWIVLSFALARWMFHRSLVADDSFQTVPTAKPSARRIEISAWPSRIFSDPLAALIQKEMQSLVRMPKFRVLFGMSCILGIAVFVPAALNSGDPASAFMRNNLIPVVNVYGLLLLSDTLLLNAFGLDRGAAQAYFVTPVALSVVLRAKNLTAIFFVILQSTVILLVAFVARAPISRMSVASGILASAVVTVFLLAAGNFTSLSMPRPIDPRQTFKKQAGAKMQIWLLACSLGLFVLVGFAFLARYALNSDSVFLLVLIFEFLVGLIVYHLGLQSAVERGLRNSETVVELLSRSSSPVSLG